MDRACRYHNHKHHGHADVCTTFSMVLMLHACLDRHLVMLHAQTLPRMELITTIHGMSMSTSD